MVTVKNQEQLKFLKEAGKRQASYIKELKANIKEGVSADFLDKLAYKLITEGGDKPAFLGYKSDKESDPFPGTICLSINNEAVHGLPKEDKILKNGDIVSIDIGLSHNGMIVDSAITMALGDVPKDAKTLIKTTEDCLEKGIKMARAGNHIGDIGHIIEKTAKDAGFSIADSLAGHGVGFELHEDPYVPNYGTPGGGLKMEAGMVFAIEPILCQGSGRIIFEKDGTVKTKDGKLSAHFEHTVIITEADPIVVTRLS